MSHLDNITARQRRGRLRDVAFAALVVFAGAVSVSSISTAVRASHSQVAHR